jgi:hypothetical protein
VDQETEMDFRRVATRFYLAIALSLLPLFSCAAPSEIVFDFDRGQSLTDDELDAVIDLAHRYGIEHIDSIRIRYVAFGNKYSIRVREKASPGVENFYHYRELAVGSKKFMGANSWQRSYERAQQRGEFVGDDFWGILIYDVKYVPLEEDGKIYEIRVGEQLRYGEFVRIIEAIRHGRIKRSDQYPAGNGGRQQWKWPHHIDRFYEDYRGATHRLSYERFSYLFYRRDQELILVGDYSVSH